MTTQPYHIEWRSMAYEDVQHIVRYLDKDNPSQAYRFAKELRDRIEPLAKHPDLGRNGRPGLPDWLRELVVHPSYIIFYRVLSATGTVEILRVKHASQQLP